MANIGGGGIKRTIGAIFAKSSDHTTAITARTASSSIMVHRDVLNFRGGVGEEVIDEFHFVMNFWRWRSESVRAEVIERRGDL